MSETVYMLIAKEDVPALGILAGDVIRWETQSDGRQFTVHRHADLDMGTLLVALNAGQLEPWIVTPASSSSKAPSPEEALGEGLRPHLRLHRRMG